MEFSRHKYWSGLPFPSLGDLPDPGIEPRSPALAGRFFTTETPGKPRVDVLTREWGDCLGRKHPEDKKEKKIIYCQPPCERAGLKDVV